MNWDETFVKSLELYEQHSKCSAKQVACILVKDNNILSIGLNGTLPGKENCCNKFKKEDDKWYKKIDNNNIFDYNNWKRCENNEHSEWSKLNEVHAEMNAIKKATQDGHFDLRGSTAYITYSPCFNCAKMLVLFGIKKIVFKKLYDDSKEVMKFLDDNNVEIIHWEQQRENIFIRVDYMGYIEDIQVDGQYIYDIRRQAPFINVNSYDNIYNTINNINNLYKNTYITVIEYMADDVHRDDDFLFKGIEFDVVQELVYRHGPVRRLKLKN